MSWTIRVYEPDGSALRTEAINGVLTDQGTLADEGAVAIRTFDPPIVVPPGTSKVLNLYVKQTALQVQPRGIVQMLIDEHQVFWGPAVIVPSLATPGSGPFDRDRDALERVTVIGGEQLLKDTILGPRLIEEPTDVAAIAHEFCSLYAHPALTIDEANFPDVGAQLREFYAPEMTMYDALAYLATTVPGGAVFGVNAAGEVYFLANEPAES